MKTYLLIYDDSFYKIKQTPNDDYLFFDDNPVAIVLLTEEMIDEICRLKEEDNKNG